MKHKRICEICGSEYSYCPNCAEYAGLPQWMFLFDKENCKKIYDVLNSYRANEITAFEAKAKLDSLALPKEEKMQKGFVDLIKEIRNKSKEQLNQGDSNDATKSKKKR